MFVVHKMAWMEESYVALLDNTNVLEDVVTCPDYGFGSHEETVEPIDCGVVPELH